MQAFLENPTVRGKQRVIGGYHAQRGWFYAEVQRVAKKWIPRLGDDIVLQTFLDIRRAFEWGSGVVRVTVRPGAEQRQYRQFLYELMAALDDLHAPENVAGWVIKMCGELKRPTLLSNKDIKDQLSFADKLWRPTNPVSRFLNGQLCSASLRSLDDRALRIAEPFFLLKELNRILQGDCIYEEQRFSEVHLRGETRYVLNTCKTSRRERVALNRLLLEDAYPREIARSDYLPQLPQSQRLLLSYAEMAAEIVANGGPRFEESLLRKTAERLRLSGSQKACECPD